MHSGQNSSPKPFVIVISDSEDEDSDCDDSHGLIGRSKGSLDLSSSSNTTIPTSSDTSQASSNRTTLQVATWKQNVKNTSEVKQTAAVDTPVAVVIDLTSDDADDNTAGQSATRQVFTKWPVVSTSTLPSSTFSSVYKDSNISTFSAPMSSGRNCSANAAPPKSTLNSTDRQAFTKDWTGQLSRISPSQQYDRGDGACIKSACWNTSLGDDYSKMDTNDDCAPMVFGSPPTKDTKGRPQSALALDTAEVAQPMEIECDVDFAKFGDSMLNRFCDTMPKQFDNRMLTAFGDTMITDMPSGCPVGFGIPTVRDEEKMEIDYDSGLLPMLFVADDTFKTVPKSKVAGVICAKGKCRKRRFEQRDVVTKTKHNKRRKMY